jgi:hypothetical protein
MCHCIFYYRTHACNSFPKKKNSTLFHIGTWNFSRFLLVTLDTEFAFHRLNPYGSRLRCPCTFYYRTYACNSFLEVFFPTPFHIETWNFLWGFSELRYTWSLYFILMTLMVPELRALVLFTIGHMHLTVFVCFFLHRLIY